MDGARTSQDSGGNKGELNLTPRQWHWHELIPASPPPPSPVWVETTHPSRCDQSCLTQIIVCTNGKGAGKQQAEMTDPYKILQSP
jgi:hypothetical protein